MSEQEITTSSKTGRKKRKKRKTFVVRPYTDHPIPDDDDAFIRVKQYAKLKNIHPSTVWRWINSGKLRQPTHLSERVVGWSRRQLREDECDKG